jgi:hypothetical protein
VIIGLDALSVLQHHGFDETALAVKLYVDDPAFAPANASAGGVCPQIRGVQAGVEMVGIRIGGQRRRKVLVRMREPPSPRRQD